MSAPNSSGRWSAGEAKVLSITSRAADAPDEVARSRMTSAAAAMSVTFSSGFDGVSSQTSLVRALSPSHSASGSPARSTYRASPAPAGRCTRSK